MSVVKLLSRIVAPSDIEVDDNVANTGKTLVSSQRFWFYRSACAGPLFLFLRYICLFSPARSYVWNYFGSFDAICLYFQCSHP